ncbi:MAG: hypothetical protein RI885_2153 [Actinomycetota bacterium]
MMRRRVIEPRRLPGADGGSPPRPSPGRTRIPSANRRGTSTTRTTTGSGPTSRRTGADAAPVRAPRPHPFAPCTRTRPQPPRPQPPRPQPPRPRSPHPQTAPPADPPCTHHIESPSPDLWFFRGLVTGDYSGFAGGRGQVGGSGQVGGRARVGGSGCQACLPDPPSVAVPESVWSPSGDGRPASRSRIWMSSSSCVGGTSSGVAVSAAFCLANAVFIM